MCSSLHALVLRNKYINDDAISIDYHVYDMQRKYFHWPPYQVHLFNYLLTQISNQPITWHQFNAFRHVDTVKMICRSIRMRKKGDSSDSERSIGCQMSWSEYFRRKCLADARGERRMVRVVPADRNNSNSVEACRRTSLNTQHVEPPGRWSTAARDHTEYQSCQLRTGS